MSDEAKLPAGPRVLVVEDEFLIRLTLSEVLLDEGYQVLEAETGEEALRLVAGHPDLAVMLTDIQLPGVLDGRALVRRVRETMPGLPVIFMSGRPDSIGKPEPGSREVHIAKPYLPSEICAAVQKMLQPA